LRTADHRIIRKIMPVFTQRSLAPTPFSLSVLLSAVITARVEGAHPASDTWMRAIVKIEVPIVRSVDGYPRNFLEHCSATIISPGPHPLLISAWHCFDGHDAMASPATLLTENGPIALELVASGGSMAEDWAMLRGKVAWVPKAWIPVSRVRASKGTRVSAAGFSRPSETGVNNTERSLERTLIIDSDCQVTAAGFLPIASSCVIQQGASGGAILGRTQSGSVRVYGIISTGDGASVSYFYPADLLSLRHRP
jgi:hypothetical protein